jgi:hypothetical protein
MQLGVGICFATAIDTVKWVAMQLRVRVESVEPGSPAARAGSWPATASCR